MIIPNVSSWWATGVSCSLQPLLKKQKECTVAPLDGGHGEIAEIQGAVTAIFENVFAEASQKELFGAGKILRTHLYCFDIIM